MIPLRDIVCIFFDTVDVLSMAPIELQDFDRQFQQPIYSHWLLAEQDIEKRKEEAEMRVASQ